MTNPTLPPNWEPNDPTTWEFETTVDSYAGEHSSGAIYRRLLTVNHAATDYESVWELRRQIAAEGDPGDTARWWFRVLGPIHRWQCAVAEELPERIDAVCDRAGVDRNESLGDDLEAEAECCADLLALLRPESPA